MRQLAVLFALFAALTVGCESSSDTSSSSASDAVAAGGDAADAMLAHDTAMDHDGMMSHDAMMDHDGMMSHDAMMDHDGMMGHDAAMDHDANMAPDTVVEPTKQLNLEATWKATVATGQNRLSIRVQDHADAPVTGATITVDPQMPIHGHGSSETPVVTEIGAGEYEAFPVTFTMSGPWVVTITATEGERMGKLALDVVVP